MMLKVFEQYLGLARYIGGDYAVGYCRGLRRFQNRAYGSDIEHAAWMTLARDPGAGDRGKGYLDGLAGRPPTGFDGTGDFL